MIILGGDISTHFGVAIVDCSEFNKPQVLMSEEIKYHYKLKGEARNQAILDRLAEIIEEHKPEEACLEGYAINSRRLGGNIPLIELGGLSKYLLHLYGVPRTIVSPTALKLFATGHGDADKQAIMDMLLEQRGIKVVNDNEADAINAALFLACLKAKLLVPSEQMEAIHNFLNPPKKKPKKRKKAIDKAA